ncbi:hypothetical protein J2X77_002124 [Sphingobacterium sp. 2149]|nr:hypothetical protein [Sphingobacterium sp. 2149]
MASRISAYVQRNKTIDFMLSAVINLLKRTYNTG